MKPNKIILKNLAQITGSELALLTSLSINININKSNGMEPHYIHAQKNKICPICLKESTYINRIWDILFVTNCPIHHCVLQERCICCNQEITYKRRSLYHCNCGYDYRDNEPYFIHKPKDIMGSNVFSEYFKINNLNNKLVHLSLNDKARFIMLHNTINNTKVNMNVNNRKFSPNYFLGLTFREINEITYGAYNTFNDWPAGFFNLLDSVSSWNKKYNHSIISNGVTNRFREVHRILKEKFIDHPYLLNTFEDYLLLNKNEFVISIAKMKELKMKDNKLLFGVEAANFLNLGRDTVRNLIENKILEGVIEVTNKKVKYFYITLESAIKFKRRIESMLHESEVRTILGVSETALNNILEGNMLETFCIQRNKNRLRYVCPKSIEKLFNSLDSKVLSNKEPKNIKLVNFYEAFLNAKNTKKDLSLTIKNFIFEIMNNNHLYPDYKNYNEKGFKSYYFNKHKLKKYFKDQTEKEDRCKTRAEALKLLNITHSLLYQLIKNGFINILPRKNKYQKIRIPLSEIEKFKRLYVDVNTIKKEYNFDINITPSYFMKKGILPIIEVSKGKSIKYIFKRSDIKSLFENGNAKK